MTLNRSDNTSIEVHTPLCAEEDTHTHTHREKWNTDGIGVSRAGQTIDRSETRRRREKRIQSEQQDMDVKITSKKTTFLKWNSKVTHPIWRKKTVCSFACRPRILSLPSQPLLPDPSHPHTPTSLFWQVTRNHLCREWNTIKKILILFLKFFNRVLEWLFKTKKNSSSKRRRNETR